MDNGWVIVSEAWFEGPPLDIHPVGLWIDPVDKQVWLQDGSPKYGLGAQVLVQDGVAIQVEGPAFKPPARGTTEPIPSITRRA